ncbi:MAG: ABC transporter permease [Xanthomonadales bacterium]|nr:ABC transporter permease [Xanthomonadales bacterium]
MNPFRSLRSVRHAPAFSVAVFALVAAAVLVNASAFSAIHALRWKALPFTDGDALVEPRANLQAYGFKVGLTELQRAAIDAERATFTGALGFTTARGNAEDGRSWSIARVTPNFHAVLGVPAALGRGFVAGDAVPGADGVLVLGDTAWRSRFGADPDVIGRTLRFGERTWTVIGVMPRGFAFPDTDTEAWRPYVMNDAERADAERGNVGELSVVARLAPGRTLAQAQASIARILADDASLAEQRTSGGLVGDVRAWRERYAESGRQALGLFQLAALVLLAVVVANLVNLQLDRLLARSREFDIRRALGAGEGAILRSALADLAPPVFAGLAAGLALAPGVIALLRARELLPGNLPQGAGFGAATLAAGFAIALVAMAAGVLAVLATRGAARLSARGGVGTLGRLRPALLVAQIMLTTALLGSTALLLRSAVNLLGVERGFDADGVVLTLVDPVGVTMNGRTYDGRNDRQKYEAVVRAIRHEVAVLPGVQQAAVATAAPFSGWESLSSYRHPGTPDAIAARGRGIGPGYFAALGIPLVAGRDFTAADAHAESPVVVDEVYRDRYLAGSDPLGASIDIDTGNGFRRARIVGMARTAKHESLEEATPLPTVYQYHDAPLPVFWLVTRVHGDAAAFAGTLRQRVEALIPGGSIGINQPLAELVDASLAPRRTLLQSLGAFAAITLALAALGLAAVLGFAIRRRTAELGVRMALGATPARVRSLVLRQGGRLVVAGLVLGGALGLGLARLLADRLFDIGFADPASWAVTLALVAAVALAACWLPARRAAAIDPIEALRHE